MACFLRFSLLIWLMYSIQSSYGYLVLTNDDEMISKTTLFCLSCEHSSPVALYDTSNNIAAVFLQGLIFY